MSANDIGFPPPGVHVRCQENRSVSVRLFDRANPYANCVHHTVEAPDVRQSLVPPGGSFG